MNPTVLAVITASVLVVTARPRRRGRRPTASTPTASTPTASTPPDAVPPDCERSPRSLRTRAIGRTHRERDDAAIVARWCESLARSVRGGDTVAAALRNTDVPIGHEPAVDRVIREIERTGRVGLPLTDVTANLALALAVLSAALEHGGPAAEPLDRAAGVLRARSAEHAERQVQSAQARLSAQVMTALPLVMLVLLLVSSRSVRSAVATPFGATVLLVGAALNMVGWRWMRRIIGSAAR